MSRVGVRRARDDDRDLLLIWRNDPVSVATSRSQAAVDAATHARWFAGVMANPDIALFIGELDEQPIGMTRFDTDRGSGHAVVSINLDPATRGKGLAGPFLVAAIEALRSEGRVRIDALVRRDNAPSLRLFASAGFGLNRSDEEFVHFTLD